MLAAQLVQSRQHRCGTHALAVEGNDVTLLIGQFEVFGLVRRRSGEPPESPLVPFYLRETDAELNFPLAAASLSEALRRGVTGYLCKDDVKADELGKGVRSVQDGETVLGKGVGSMVARGLGSTRGAAEHLTDRELEVIRAVAAGLSNKQIAHQAFISESTVKFHLQNASRKLNAHRRAEIVHRASAAGLL